MARRQITFGDWMRGSLASLQNGTGGRPLITKRFIDAAHDERVARTVSVKNLFTQAALRAFQSPQNQQILREYQTAREAQSRTSMVDGVPMRKGRDVQYRDGELTVKVINGYSRDSDGYTTDVIVDYPKDPGKLHMHVVFNEKGVVITEHWKQYGKVIPAPR